MSNETNKSVSEEEKVDRTISIFYALVVLVLGAAIGFFVYGNIVNENAKNPFKLGLDLAGGAHLIYEADTTGVKPEEVPELM